MRTKAHISGTLAAVAIMCASLLVFAFSTSSVLAQRGHVFGPSFGASGSGAGELSFISPPPGESAIRTSLGVDNATHNVYVADPGNHRVDEFEASGAFVRAWGWGVQNGTAEFQVCTTQTTCQAGLPGTSPGEFVTPAFVAVDNTSGGGGDVYVGDAEGETVSKFTEAGQLIASWGVKGQITISEGTGTGILTSGSTRVESVVGTTGAFSVDQEISGAGIPAGSQIREANGGVLEISKPATASGSVSLTAREVLGSIEGVAVDAAGRLWVSALRVGFGGQGVYLFDPDGTFTGKRRGQSGEYSPQSIAIGSAGEFYAVENAKQIQKFSPGGEPLGAINEIEGPSVSGVAVDSSTDELYVDMSGSAVYVFAPSCVPPKEAFGSYCVPILTFTSPQLSGGAGLAVDSSSGSPSSHAVYVVETANDRIDTLILEPPAAPTVENGSQSVSDVSANSATFEAVVDPRSEPTEEPTSYRFQYTTEEQFQREGFAGASSAPTPDGQLAPNYGPVAIVAHAQGLLPDTVYRFRVVAENAISRKEGKPVEGERDEAGKEIIRVFTTQTDGVFALPDARAWELVSPPDKHGALISGLFPHQVEQASADGGAITYIASAPTESGPPGNSMETQVLSARTTGSWGSQDISTSRDVANGLAGNSSEYRFFSSDMSLALAQINGNVPVPALSSEATEMTPFLRNNYVGEDQEDLCSKSCYRPLVTGAPGIANVPEGTEFGKAPCGTIECGPSFGGASPDGSHIVLTSKVPLTEGAPIGSLYEWHAGELQLVSVLPGGEPAPEGSQLELGSVSGEEGGVPLPVMRNSVSADGSRIVWSTGGVGAGGIHLYVRDAVREETIELGGTGARFQTASADGSRVFFTVGSDLLVFEAPSGGVLSAGRVTDLTPGGGLRELVLGISRDGSSVYFVADTVLAGTPSAEGEHAQAGQPNLYAYRAGAIRLVAVLSPHDSQDWGEGTAPNTARVSPDGGALAFMSERPLTGYDNRDVTTGERDEEVFLYDATANGGEGRLVCASCDPTGARPHGIVATDSLAAPTLFDSQLAWKDRRIAANVPGWTSPLYESRYLSDAGRLFFNSADALVPSDTNGTTDVYEYEPPGVGDCSNASLTFSALSGGCVDLISSGTAKEESAFLDASENGDDVFFLTPAQLSPQDSDSVLDVYDARVGGGFPVPPPPPACEGDACQSPVAAPNDPTPGSLTYRGPGNPGPLLTVRKTVKKKAVKCSKGKRLKHGKCVKSKGATKKRAGRTIRTGAKRRTK